MLQRHVITYISKGTIILNLKQGVKESVILMEERLHFINPVSILTPVLMVKLNVTYPTRIITYLLQFQV